MSSAKTVGSALATSRTALEDIVRSIAAELRPWKCSERDVLAKVRKTIDGFREDSAHPPDIGYRNENRQTAQDCIEVLDKAEKQLAKLSPEFITSLAFATYFDPTFVVTCKKDWDELERRKDQEAEILSKDWTELLERTARFAERCKRAIFAPTRLTSDSGEPVDGDPTGFVSKIRYKKEMAAVFALLLITGVSTKIPAAGDRNTPFCVIASLLFEMITGEREANLLRACKSVLSRLRTLNALEDWHACADDASARN
jgi:hypothetical protein